MHLAWTPDVSKSGNTQATAPPFGVIDRSAERTAVEIADYRAARRACPWGEELGVRGRVQAVVIAYETGSVTPCGDVGLMSGVDFAVGRSSKA